MGAISSAKAEKLKKATPVIRQLSRYGKDGFWKFLTNFDEDDGSLLASVGDDLSGTSEDSFTLAKGETDGTFVLSVNTTGTNHAVTLKAPVTTQAVTLTLPDIAADTLVSKTSTDTLTNETLTPPTLTVPVIDAFTSATHNHSNAAGGGALSLPSMSGTTAATFTVFEGGATARLILDTDSATGDFDLSLTVPNLAADATITLPDEDATLSGIGLDETFSGAKTFSGGIVASGSDAIDFSGNSGAFKTSTGINTFGGNAVFEGDVSIDAGKDFDLSGGAGTFATGTGAVSILGDTTVAAGKDLNFAKGAGYIQMNGATAGALKIGPFDDLSYTLTIAVADQTGTATLTIPDMGGAAGNLMVDSIDNTFTTGQTIAEDDANNTSVTDLLTLTHTTSGSPGANMGLGISIIVENDSDATTEVSSIDFVTTNDGTKGSLDTDIHFKTMLGGGLSTAILVDASAQEVQIGASAADGDGLNALRIYPHTTASRGSLVLTSAINGSGDFVTTVTQATDVSESQTITIPDSDASTDTFALLGTAQTFTSAQTVHISASATTTVADCLTLKHETDGTPAAGIGAGISFQITDLAGATVEEQGSIDFVMGVVTDGSEDASMVVSLNTDGDITQAFKLDAENNKAIFGVASEAGSISSVQIFPSNAAARGSLILACATNGSGDYDTTVTQATGVSEDQTITIPDADSGADTFDLIGTAQTVSAVKTFTACPLITLDDTTDGLVDGLVLTHSSSDQHATAGDGVSISFELENANGTSTVEEYGRLDVLSSVITDGSEDADIVLSAMIAGTVREVMRVDSSDESLTIGYDGTNTESIDKIRIFGQSASKGSLVIQSVANDGNTDLTIKNEAQAQATTLTIPDCSNATANFLLTYGNFTLNGTPTFAVDTIHQDDVYAKFGSGSDAYIGWTTADTNAESLMLVLPEAAGNVVPVLTIGDTSSDTDLGFFDGTTQPTIALLDADADCHLDITYSADDVASIATAGGNGGVSALGIGATANTLTLKGVVKGEAEGYMTHSLVVDATIAQINAGHSLVTCPTGRQLQLIDVKAISYGEACAGTTTVDIIEETSGDKLVTFAVGDLAQSAILSMEEDGTVLADGASFTAQTVDKDIQVSKTGNDVTTATGVRFIIQYLIL